MWSGLDELDESDMWAFFLGFLAGEGSFSITITTRKRDGLPSACPVFAIKLEICDKELLELFRDTTGIGHINEAKSQGRHYVEWRTSNLESCMYIRDQIESHASGTPFTQTSKYDSLQTWSECLELIEQGEHLTKEGLVRLSELRDEMNDDRRGRTTGEVIEEFDL